MSRTFLDALASGEPDAPWFARMAMEFLTRGEPAKAADLCLGGLRRHSDYGTGYLVLGKCYTALGRNRDALLALRKALALVPDNTAVRKLLADRMEHEERDFQAFCALLGSEPAEDAGALTLEQFLAGGAGESSVDYLLKQLEEVRKIRPKESAAEETGAGTEQRAESAKIITVTLAEIYVSQGQLEEAIAAYRKLIALRPQEETRYAARIRELEERMGGAE